MSKMKVIILSLAVLALIGSICTIYINKTSDGILLKNGIHNSNVKLTLDNQWFRFYLYEKEENNTPKLGIITIQKHSNSTFANSIYSNNMVSTILEKTYIYAPYPTIENGSIVSHKIIGGVLLSANEKDIEIPINKNSTIKPSILKTVGDKTYFIYDLGKNDYYSIP